MKLALPQGMTRVHADGKVYVAGAGGLIDVPLVAVSALLKVGCNYAPATGTTALRPTTNLTPGQFYFDGTLNKPIWRNTANTGWVDATGTAV